MAREPDDIYETEYRPGATRPIINVPLRSRRVRLQGPEVYTRDIELREYQVGMWMWGLPTIAELAFLVGVFVGLILMMIVVLFAR